MDGKKDVVSVPVLGANSYYDSLFDSGSSSVVFSYVVGNASEPLLKWDHTFEDGASVLLVLSPPAMLVDWFDGCLLLSSDCFLIKQGQRLHPSQLFGGFFFFFFACVLSGELFFFAHNRRWWYRPTKVIAYQFCGNYRNIL